MKVVNFLISQHANLTAAGGKLGRTAAHFAAQASYDEVVDELLDRKGDNIFSLRDNAGRTPLLLAIELGRDEIVGKIISKNPKFYFERVSGSEDSGLHIAAKFNRPDIVRPLLERCQQKEEFILLVNANGETALHTAISYGHAEIVRLLFSAMGSKETSMEKAVLARENSDRTVIHTLATACSQANALEIARLLMTHLRKAENLVDVFGETPLETAVRRNCVGLVTLFLEAGMPCSVFGDKQTRRLHAPSCGKTTWLQRHG